MSNFIIKDLKTVHDKMNMVQSLKDIAVTAKVSKIDAKSTKHELDQKYENLKCKITPIDPSSQKFKFLSNYLNNSQGDTHCKHKCVDIYEIEREGETKRYNSKIGNDRLLWHGSGYYNYGGILSQGLRIAPPEAPVSGYMFGKGVYFADVASKSVQYTSYHSSNNFGLMLLCKVAIGKPNRLYGSDSSITLARLPKGTNAT